MLQGVRLLGLLLAVRYLTSRLCSRLLMTIRRQHPTMFQGFTRPISALLFIPKYRIACKREGCLKKRQASTSPKVHDFQQDRIIILRAPLLPQPTFGACAIHESISLQLASLLSQSRWMGAFFSSLQGRAAGQWQAGWRSTQAICDQPLSRADLCPHWFVVVAVRF